MTLTNDSRTIIDAMPNADRLKLIDRLIGTVDPKGLAELRYAFDKLNEHQAAEIRNFITLSTAHISPAARHWLEANAHANALQRQSDAHPVAAFLYGWMMWVPDAIDWQDMADLYPDLRAPMEMANRLDCTHILFDADGPVDPTLPTWGEDEGALEGLTEDEQAAMALVDEGGLHDELDDDGRAAEAIHPEDGQPMDAVHVIPIGTPIHFTESGRRKLDAAGHATVNRAALSELQEAIADLLLDVDAEIEQRQTGGNDEDWKPLQEKSSRVAKAFRAL